MAGVPGELLVKYLHTNYPKKPNSKFPHSVFKIYTQLLSLVTCIIYRRQGVVRCIQNLVQNPQEKGQFRDVRMAGMIVLRWILT